MALINNFLELRSDAFKITHHSRRPFPMRTDSIGPWLDSLGFLTWLAALTNSALVYLFRDISAKNGNGSVNGVDNGAPGASPSCSMVKRNLLFKAAVIALAASHGYIVVRGLVRHLLEKIVWDGCKEMEVAERKAREVKEQYLKIIEGVERESADVDIREEDESIAFWGFDEGLDEIRRSLKDA
jgi:hypothetical protein